ncbi:MAG TPA: hypothetical protein VFQ92_04250 [Blastocatellia bacterium]|nr:hypothetical protein [Blastocatellia bacterium]
MKKYLMGLALSGLASRVGRKSKSIIPRRHKSTTPKRASTFLLGAGLGAGVTYLLSQKLGRK